MARLIGRRRAALVVAVVAIALQIPYPLLDGSARDRVSVSIVVALATAAIVHAWTQSGPRYAVTFFAITAGIGLLAELVGTATCVPFGCYAYDDRLGPMINDVPALIALAWTAGSYPIWICAGLITNNRPARIALTAAGLTGWDMYLDPQMVADGHWNWTSPDLTLPGVTDIPVTNYVGWFVVGLLMAGTLSLARGELRGSIADNAAPIALFGWTWLGSAIAHAFFLEGAQLDYSALYGLAGMGIVGIPLILRLRSDRVITRAAGTPVA